MAICNSCGNHYENCMEITLAGRSYTFDCFECAVNVIAHRCHHCGTKIIGHGLEADAMYFCCAHCARSAGKEGLRDSA